MTEKQIKTIILFAQNYSLQVIAKKQQVSLTTIRERIKSLSKNHYREFGNALALRESYKRIRNSMRNDIRIGDRTNGDVGWESAIKDKF